MDVYKVDRVRRQYQSVSRKRQANMDDMEWNEAQQTNVRNRQMQRERCALSHADA